MRVICPNCGTPDLVKGTMVINPLTDAGFGGVFCAHCNFHEQIDLFYANRINTGIQQPDEMERFNQYLLGNNKRLGIDPNTKRAPMK